MGKLKKLQIIEIISNWKNEAIMILDSKDDTQERCRSRERQGVNINIDV